MVSTRPDASPEAAGDTPDRAPKMPTARARSRPSTKVTASSDSAAGAMRAAPNPCEEEKSTEEQAVGDDDPLHRAVADTEVALDRR
jgi:hypothetical protein